MLPFVVRGALTARATEGGGNVLLSYRTSWTIYNSGDEVGSNQGGRDVRFVIIYRIIINSSGIK